MHRLTAVMALACLTGCAAPEVTLGVAWLDDEAATAVRVAAGQWSQAGVPMRVTAVAPQWRVGRAEGCARSSGVAQAPGVTCHGGDVITLRPGLHGAQLLTVALHELGHVAGLDDGGHGLMGPNGAFLGCIDTVSALAAGGTEGTCTEEEEP